MKEKRKARLLAHYLPQFHPIKENDEWWGKGFTEWTRVASAKPLFPGHYQPRIPADLGFYDLRVPETRIAQAEMANEYGIEGFIYWHYWFEGEQLLERPFLEVLNSGEPHFPFCLGWAVHDWTGEWSGGSRQIIKKQTFGGFEDYRSHFYYLLKAFQDERYFKVNDKPLFYIMMRNEIPKLKKMIDMWQELAIKEGLNGLHFIAYPWRYHRKEERWDVNDYGFNGGTFSYQSDPYKINPIIQKYRKYCKIPVRIYDYKKGIPNYLVKKDLPYRYHPTVIPNWDNSPRVGLQAMILHNSNPEYFRIHLKEALDIVKDYPDEEKIIFVKSWNEWAESNYLEPDMKFGRGYLEVIKEEIIVE